MHIKLGKINISTNILSFLFYIQPHFFPILTSLCPLNNIQITECHWAPLNQELTKRLFQTVLIPKAHNVAQMNAHSCHEVLRVGRSPSQRLCYRLPLCGLRLKRSVAWSRQWPRALVKSGSCWGKGYDGMDVGDASGQRLGNKWLQLCLLRGKHPPACNGVLEQLERGAWAAQISFC